MFRVFVLTGNPSEVERQTGYCSETVMKYRETDQWDARAEVARAQARKNSDYKLTETLSATLNYCKALKNMFGARLKKIQQAIEKHVEDPTHFPMPTEVMDLDLPSIVDALDKVTRLETFASGGADQRIEVNDAEYQRQMNERREMRIAEYRIIEARVKGQLAAPVSTPGANPNADGHVDNAADDAE